MSGEICEYCGNDPCDCPIFDLPEEPQSPDWAYDDDTEESPEEPNL